VSAFADIKISSTDFNKDGPQPVKQEIAALRRAFPGLTSSGAAAQSPAAVAAKRAPAGKQARRRGRKRPMSAAERRAVSERMKKYWAERNKAKG
jgi:hypothetical protein